jgi:hypothetical protein
MSTQCATELLPFQGILPGNMISGQNGTFRSTCILAVIVTSFCPHGKRLSSEDREPGKDADNVAMLPRKHMRLPVEWLAGITTVIP